jgi:hypothetical protein
MKNDIWPWFGGKYRVHCRTRREYDTLMSWKGTKHGSTYMMPNGSREWDVTILAHQRQEAMDFLGLRPRKRQKTPIGAQ